MRLNLIVAVALGTLILAAPVAAQAPRQTASLSFTTATPGAPTGVVLDVDYVNPDDPGGKPPAVRRVVTSLAAGARYDTAVPASCTAFDLTLMLLGPQACPAASIVGSGELRLDTGLPGPLRFINADVTFLNRPDELIFVNTIRGSPLRTILHAPIAGTTTTSDVPPLPGTLPDGAALDSVHFEDSVVLSADRPRRAYITTPPTCPDGLWRNSIAFTYADGVTQTVESGSPCTKPRKAKQKARKAQKRKKAGSRHDGIRVRVGAGMAAGR